MGLELASHPVFVVTGRRLLAPSAAKPSSRRTLSALVEAKRIPLDVAAIDERLVLGNGLIFGSVNSSRTHFERAIRDLKAFNRRWPGFAESLITRRVPFEKYEEAFEERLGDIKVLIEVSRPSHATHSA